MFETSCMGDENKNICKEFLETSEVTEDLLKLYCLKELESWGDMVKSIVYFQYENKKISGRWVDYDEPVEIISITDID